MKRILFNSPKIRMALGFLFAMSFGVAYAQAPELPKPEKKKDFPDLDKVTKDYEKITETARNQPGLFTLWVNKKEGKMLATLPSGYESKKFFIAMTVAGGEAFAGLQMGDMYVYWKRYNKRLALIQPNVLIRSKGDQESKDSVERLYTDSVLLDVPIKALDGGRPVIDVTQLLVGQAGKFFGARLRVSNSSLVTIKKAKTFPQNIEVAFEVPTTTGGGTPSYFSAGTAGQAGKLKTLHYSISVIPVNPGYKPRAADERIGYFTTHYYDYGEFSKRETVKRFVNRWHLEKAEASLHLSPPKQPIIFYIEHTTPIRYRRWVREGILYWNEAFRKIGIDNAIEVYYQDSRTKAHMDKDPEDVRWNFIRWLNNNYGMAVGPSRVNPLTGEILDADIILTDGWIRYFRFTFQKLLPELAMEGFSPETLAWLSEHPQWDPRVRMAPADQQQQIIEEIREKSKTLGGHAVGHMDTDLIGDDEFDGLAHRGSQLNGLCMAADFKAMDLALARMHLLMTEGQPETTSSEDPNSSGTEEEKKSPEKPEEKEPLIDGVPESIIGPMLAHLVSHEVGHTLGLRHNFKASSIYSLEAMNEPENQPLAASVMDYLPININTKEDREQGPYSMVGIGPYDNWAIEYGYTLKNDLKPILSRVADPMLPYGTDEDTWGPDPLARRYDYGSNPIDYAHNQMELAEYHRKHILDKFVDEGDSWSQARRGYEMTLILHIRALSMMANWIGGSHIYRDHKGDKDGRLPIEVVSAEKQREALKFVIEKGFDEKAFGLSPELIKHMTVAKWWDDPASIFADPAWKIHDIVSAIQTASLSMIMTPSTLRRLYDNEFLIPAEEDALTLPELLDSITDSIWGDLDQPTAKTYTVRQPLVSSMRRDLQREHLDRLIDLSMAGRGFLAAYKPIANLSHMHLRQIKSNRIEEVLRSHGNSLDSYSKAHLVDASERIEKALDAQFIQK